MADKQNMPLRIIKDGLQLLSPFDNVTMMDVIQLSGRYDYLLLGIDYSKFDESLGTVVQSFFQEVHSDGYVVDPGKNVYEFNSDEDFNYNSMVSGTISKLITKGAFTVEPTPPIDDHYLITDVTDLSGRTATTWKFPSRTCKDATTLNVIEENATLIDYGETADDVLYNPFDETNKDYPIIEDKDYRCEMGLKLYTETQFSLSTDNYRLTCEAKHGDNSIDKVCTDLRSYPTGTASSIESETLNMSSDYTLSCSIDPQLGHFIVGTYTALLYRIPLTSGDTYERKTLYDAIVAGIPYLPLRASTARGYNFSPSSLFTTYTQNGTEYEVQVLVISKDASSLSLFEGESIIVDFGIFSNFKELLKYNDLYSPSIFTGQKVSSSYWDSSIDFSQKIEDIISYAPTSGKMIFREKADTTKLFAIVGCLESEMDDHSRYFQTEDFIKDETATYSADTSNLADQEKDALDLIDKIDTKPLRNSLVTLQSYLTNTAKQKFIEMSALSNITVATNIANIDVSLSEQQDIINEITIGVAGIKTSINLAVSNMEKILSNNTINTNMQVKSVPLSRISELVSSPLSFTSMNAIDETIQKTTDLIAAVDAATKGLTSYVKSRKITARKQYTSHASSGSLMTNELIGAKIILMNSDGDFGICRQGLLLDESTFPSVTSVDNWILDQALILDEDSLIDTGTLEISRNRMLTFGILRIDNGWNLNEVEQKLHGAVRDGFHLSLTSENNKRIVFPLLRSSNMIFGNNDGYWKSLSHEQIGEIMFDDFSELIYDSSSFSKWSDWFFCRGAKHVTHIIETSDTSLDKEILFIDIGKSLSYQLSNPDGTLGSETIYNDKYQYLIRIPDKESKLRFVLMPMSSLVANEELVKTRYADSFDYFNSKYGDASNIVKLTPFALYGLSKKIFNNHYNYIKPFMEDVRSNTNQSKGILSSLEGTANYHITRPGILRVRDKFMLSYAPFQHLTEADPSPVVININIPSHTWINTFLNKADKGSYFDHLLNITQSNLYNWGYCAILKGTEIATRSNDSTISSPNGAQLLKLITKDLVADVDVGPNWTTPPGDLEFNLCIGNLSSFKIEGRPLLIDQSYASYLKDQTIISNGKFALTVYFDIMAKQVVEQHRTLQRLQTEQATIALLLLDAMQKKLDTEISTGHSGLTLSYETNRVLRTMTINVQMERI